MTAPRRTCDVFVSSAAERFSQMTRDARADAIAPRDAAAMLGTFETLSIVFAVYAVVFLAHRAEQTVSTER